MYEFEKNKLKAYLKDLYQPLKNYNCIIAGGTITSLFCNRDINDVDVYFRSKEDLAEFLYENIEGSAWVLAKTSKALLLKWGEIELQLIWFDVFNNAEAIFDTFDYTVCMGAYDLQNEEFVLHKDFLQHNSQRILKYNPKTAFPIVSALRVDKYKGKGYKISKSEYLRVVLSCMNLKIDNYEDLKEQLGGMYGVNYDDVIEPLQDEEFDLGEIIEKMSDICLHEDYFKKQNYRVKIDNFEEMVCEMLGIKRRMFELNGTKYIIGRDGIESLCIISNPNLYEKVDLMKDVLKDNKLYKYVNKVGDKYFSFWDKTFEYKLGEMVFPKDVSWSGGIYASLPHNLRYTTYHNQSTKVILELEIEEKDILSITHVKLSRAKAMREVTEEEFNNILSR